MLMSTPVNHGRSWTDEANADLRSMFEQGLALEVIAAKMDRTQGAICGQMERLKLVVNFGGVIHRMDPTPWVDLRKLR